jgi:hypothetical protein
MKRAHICASGFATGTFSAYLDGDGWLVAEVPRSPYPRVSKAARDADARSQRADRRSTPGGSPNATKADPPMARLARENNRANSASHGSRNVCREADDSSGIPFR